MTQETEPAATEPKAKSGKAWIVWTLAVVFIAGSIAVMFAADYYFAPGLSDPSTLPDAVGK